MVTEIGQSQQPEQSRIEALVTTIAGEIDEGMAKHSSSANFQTNCLERTDTPSCNALFADMASYGIFLANMQARIRAGLPDVDELVVREGVERAQSILSNIVADSTDPLRRVSALLILNYADNVSPINPALMHPEAYSDLFSRSPLEVRLLGRLHRTVPLVAKGAATEFASVAADPASDVRARRYALVALGHSESAAELLDVISSRSDWEGNWTDAAHALVLCGKSCSVGMQTFLDRGGRDARMALFEAGGLASERDAEAIREILVRNVPADADPEELALIRAAGL